MARSRPGISGLGTLSFPTSTRSAAAESTFVRGVLLLHVFEYEDAATDGRGARGQGAVASRARVSARGGHPVRPGDEAERDTLYSRAMKAVLDAYPRDDEAGTFYALSLLGLSQGVVYGWRTELAKRMRGSGSG